MKTKLQILLGTGLLVFSVIFVDVESANACYEENPLSCALLLDWCVNGENWTPMNCTNYLLMCQPCPPPPPPNNCAETTCMDDDCWDGYEWVGGWLDCTTTEFNLTVAPGLRTTIIGNPNNIVVSSGSQAYSVPENTTVNLFANPNAGSVFTGWTGDCVAAGTTPTCSVTMNNNKSVGTNDSTITPYCGDSTINGSESCDNGSNNGVCPKTCSSSCGNNVCPSGSTTSVPWREVAP